MRLADWLERSGTSPAALAERCGVHPVTVYKWRSGAITPRPAQLTSIVAATGGEVTANDFLPGSTALPGLAEEQAPYVSEARTLGLDPDAIAARAVQDAVRAEKERRWIEENRAAMEAQNAWVEKHGLPLAKHRMF